MRLFGGEDRAASAAERKRVPRHSSGWDALRKYIQEQESLRVLDIGPTSSTNINLLASMGHSIYMADVVTDAQAPSWKTIDEDGVATFRSGDFLDETLPLGERKFDVVLFWDCADFVPAALVGPLVQRLHGAMAPGGKLLAFSHIKPEGTFQRYHLRQEADVDVQPVNDLGVTTVYTNRQMENLFAAYANHRFFLAKDNLREMLVTR